ncbi:MAG: hypothetical protein ACK5LC_13725 [Coprobacillaceae bacterium]
MFGFNEWSIKPDDFKYTDYFIIFDGVHKPIILYGCFKALAFGIEVTKNWPQTLEETFKMSEKFFLKKSTLKSSDDEQIEAENIMCKNGKVEMFFSNWFDTTRGYKWLYQIETENTLAKNVIQGYKAYLAEKMYNYNLLLKLSNELQGSVPEYKKYGKNKADYAKSMMEEVDLSLSFRKEGDASRIKPSFEYMKLKIENSLIFFNHKNYYQNLLHGVSEKELAEDLMQSEEGKEILRDFVSHLIHYGLSKNMKPLWIDKERQQENGWL